MTTKNPIYTVNELTQNIKSILEEKYFQISVEGEVSSVTQATSGHLYFRLKDAHSQIACVMFYYSKRTNILQIKQGQKIVVDGKVTVYPPQGNYQIIVSSLIPLGQGSLQAAFEQLKTKLLQEGIFEQQYKKQLPQFPETIGIITSPTGAVIQDILSILERRWQGLQIYIFPASMQGISSPEEIIQGIDFFHKNYCPDVIIIARGGGSVEELQGFNDEQLARKTFGSKIPIISAIGHEVDYTILDFVADYRAPTPSVAAEIVVQKKSDIQDKLNSFKKLYIQSARQSMYNKKLLFQKIYSQLFSHSNVLQIHVQKIDWLTMDLIKAVHQKIDTQRNIHNNYQQQLLQKPIYDYFIHKKNKLLELKNTLKNSFFNTIKEKQQKTTFLSNILLSLSPDAVLKRGYIIAKDDNNQVVSSTKQIQNEQELQLIFHSGKARVKVLKKEPQ